MVTPVLVAAPPPIMAPTVTSTVYMVGMPEVSSDLAPAQTVIQATVVPIAKYLTCARQLQIHQMMVQMGTSTALMVVQLVVLLGLAPALPAMKALVV